MKPEDLQFKQPKFYRMAFGAVGLGNLSDETVSLILHVVQAVDEMGGELGLKEIAKIQTLVESHYEEKGEE